MGARRSLLLLAWTAASAMTAACEMAQPVAGPDAGPAPQLARSVSPGARPTAADPVAPPPGVAPALASAASADVVVTVDTGSPGAAIPPDFAGLSFETGSERENNAGVTGYFFDVHNSEALTLFQQSGVRNLRMGGGSVDNTVVPASVGGMLDFTGIDKLFAFARAAHTKVIYSLRLLDGDASTDAAIAAHIWKRYEDQIESFSIGNEPDWSSYHYPPAGTGPDPQIVYYKTSVAHQGYIQKWRDFATTIAAQVPGAPFNGPDTGSNWPVDNPSPPYAPSINTDWNGVTWTTNFARDISAWSFPSSGSLAYVTQHNYPGGAVTWRDASGVVHTLTIRQMIDGMLSPEWDSRDYPALAGVSGAPALPSGVRYRLTESNPFTGAISGGSNCFGTALWALDYLHWWAEHGAVGVNFHNKQWGANNVIYYNGTDYTLYPIGYAIKAWDLGGHGDVEPSTVSNPGGLNVTAYAVGSASDLYVTIVNKEHGNGATDAAVTIAPTGFSAASAAAIVLTDGKRGDASLLTATVGGAAITNHDRWLGTWTPLSPAASGQVAVNVAASSAVVVHLHAAGSYVGPIQINQRGALELVGVGPMGGLFRDRQVDADVPHSDAGSFSGWMDASGGPVNPAASGPAAVAKNLDNRLAVFIPGADGHVHYEAQVQPGSRFGSWTDLGGDHITALQAASGADGSLYVFGIGSDGTVQENSQVAAGAGFTGWSGLGGATVRPGFVVGRDLSGSLELFAVDDRGMVLRSRQTRTGDWSGWNPLPGAALDPHLAVARDLDGRLELFGVDAGGQVWRDAQTAPGGAFGDWSQIAGKTLAPGFAVGQGRDGRLVVLGVDRAAPSHVVSCWQQHPGGAFAATWGDLGGSGLDPRLVVASTADGRIQMFSTGDDGHVHSDWQTASGGWAGWADFGDSAGVKPYPDAGASSPPAADAGSGSGTGVAPDGGSGARAAGGCQLAAGRGASGTGGGLLFLAVLAAVPVLARRRRAA